ncbi:hypothetical protein DICVIV_12260 [Dictyocaulus viviparus]|uniref:Uncharacterized protein n=1 Tax=Dictyocaulus viviparus TaxID=29172 RepID=A0A0D8XB10_DICVI|nr:hypothetical protein DICVIV_12260 [Dictyocaulus viviparus]
MDWMFVKICFITFFIVVSSAINEDVTDDGGHLWTQENDHTANSEDFLRQNFTEELRASHPIEVVFQGDEFETNSTSEFTTDEPKVTIRLPLSLEDDEDFDNISVNSEDTPNAQVQTTNSKEFDDIATTTTATASDDTTSLVDNILEDEVISSTSSPQQSIFSTTVIDVSSSTTYSKRPKINDGEVGEINRIAKKIVNLFAPKKLKRKRKLNLEQVLMKVKGNRRLISHDVEPMGDDIPIPFGWKLIQI